MRFVQDISKGILGKPDDAELWDRIVNQIPTEVLMRPCVKILNVAFGHMTEADAIVRRMVSLGRSIEDARNAIWLVEKYTPFVNYAKLRGYSPKKIFKEDFLVWANQSEHRNMKFDIIIGNPPYQSVKNNGGGEDEGGLGTASPLWPKFLKIAFDMLENKGHMVFIVPQTWASYDRTTRGTLKGAAGLRELVFSKGHLSFVDFTVGKFFNVGSTFSAFVFTKGKSAKTIVVHEHEEFKFDYATAPWMPLTGGALGISILQKTFWSEAPKFKLVNGGIEVRGNRNGHDTISTIQSPKNKTPIANTSAQYEKGKWLYSSSVQPFAGQKKVVFSDSGYSKPFYDEAGKIGLGQHAKAFFVNSKAEAEAIIALSESKLLKFGARSMLESSASSNLSLMMHRLPIVKKAMSDEELYAYFKLTKDEIALIESIVK